MEERGNGRFFLRTRTRRTRRGKGGKFLENIWRQIAGLQGPGNCWFSLRTRARRTRRDKEDKEGQFWEKSWRQITGLEGRGNGMFSPSGQGKGGQFWGKDLDANNGIGMAREWQVLPLRTRKRSTRKGQGGTILGIRF